MQNPALKAYAEFAGSYGSALEYGIRVQKVLSSAVERVVKEHIALVDTAVANLAPVASAKQPKELLDVQNALAEKVRDQFGAATKNLLKIQEETGAEIKALMQEGVEKFAAPLAQWAKKAA